MQPMDPAAIYAFNLISGERVPNIDSNVFNIMNTYNYTERTINDLHEILCENYQNNVALAIITEFSKYPFLKEATFYAYKKLGEFIIPIARQPNIILINPNIDPAALQITTMLLTTWDLDIEPNKFAYISSYNFTEQTLNHIKTLLINNGIHNNYIIAVIHEFTKMYDKYNDMSYATYYAYMKTGYFAYDITDIQKIDEIKTSIDKKLMSYSKYRTIV